MRCFSVEEFTVLLILINFLGSELVVWNAETPRGTQQFN